ncbi:MAG: membrane-bound lytic murein transglycosylase B [Gammaproteobacteria bacterium]|jgi:membrane-bound lytic murein transglycosylase B
MNIVNKLLVTFLTTSLMIGPAFAGDYSDRAEVSEFIERIAKKSEYSQLELEILFGQVKKQSHLFERLNKPAEKELQWYQYRRIFLKQKRINKGLDFWQKHEKLINTVSHKTGVSAEIIVAIIGVETFYGIYRGKDPVFDSLVTLAFDYPKRAKFFKRELEQYLLLVKEQNFAPRDLKGSYAGAMGMPQFISSSYRRYAVDYDGDGQVDLFNNIGDIIASVANYFVDHGWQRGKGIAYPLIALEENRISDIVPGVKTDYEWKTLSESGLVSREKLAGDTPVALIQLMQKDHPEYWVGLKNFYVITRYNHSELYAMAVYQLAQKLKAGMGL